MPKYNRQEIIDRYGISHAYITTYIKRGKLFEDDEEFDSNHDVNKPFFKRLEKKLKESGGKPAAPSSSKKSGGKAKTEQKELDFSGKEEREKALIEKSKSEKEQSDLKALVTNEDLQLKRLKRMKLQGELIPTELVLQTFMQHMKNINDTLYSSAEDIAAKMNKKLGGNRQDMIEIRKVIIAELNDVINDSKERSIRDIKNIMVEYSDKLKGI